MGWLGKLFGSGAKTQEAMKMALTLAMTYFGYMVANSNLDLSVS